MSRVQTSLGSWAARELLELDDDAWARLDLIVELWQRYGAAFNLVGDRGEPALFEHVREGMMAVGAARRAGWRGDAWLDIGSGAGIPGLIVAAMGNVVVHVEPRERRAAFLDLAIRAIGSSESSVVRARWSGTMWEKIGSADNYAQLDGHFGVAGTKAVMALDQWLATAPAILPRGIVVAHTRRAVADLLLPQPSGRVDYGVNAVVAFEAESLARAAT